MTFRGFHILSEKRTIDTGSSRGSVQALSRRGYSCRRLMNSFGQIPLRWPLPASKAGCARNLTRLMLLGQLEVETSDMRWA